ncbi:MAG TPA: hypothetical protein VLM75_12645 [Spirochaetota bacterium]|nr:hypothetical protein [Spirochaetota bacterium]
MQIGGLLSLGVSNADETGPAPRPGIILTATPRHGGTRRWTPALNTSPYFIAKSFAVLYPARTAVSDLEMEGMAYFATVPPGFRVALHCSRYRSE